MKNTQTETEAVIETAPVTDLVAPGVSDVTLAELDAESSATEGLDKISRMKLAIEEFELRSKLVEACRLAAVRATSPTDWVLFKDKQGAATAMLCNSGANVVIQYYGISITNLRPVNRDGIFVPVMEEDTATGEIRYTCWFDAKAHMVPGLEVKDQEAGRSSTEQFIGRGGQSSTSAMVAAADLRAACSTLARTKAARILGALNRLSLNVLEEAWTGTKKNVEDCRKGSGYGTAGDRQASSATGEDVLALQAELRTALMALTNDDEEEAKELLAEITLYNGKSLSSVTQLKNPQQFYFKWKELAAHKNYGTAAKEWVKRLRSPSKQAQDGCR